MSNNNFFNFEDYNKNYILEWKGNVCENFHKRFNNLILNPNLKISFYLDKLKVFIKTQFDKLLNCILLNVDNIEKDFNVSEDILIFF